MSKGYKFYYPSHSTRIVESRNAKFLENALISGSDQSKDLGYEKDPSEPFTSRARLIVVHNTLDVQMDVEPPQPIVEDPWVNDEVQMDQVVQELPIIVEQ